MSKRRACGKLMNPKVNSLRSSCTSPSTTAIKEPRVFVKCTAYPFTRVQRLLQFALIATPGRIFRHLSSGDSQEATLEAKGV